MISILLSIHLPSFMSKDQAIYKLSQDPDLRTDGRTIGQTDSQTDKRTDGKPIVPSGYTGRELSSLVVRKLAV